MKIRFWLLALTALLAACTETRTTWQESTLPIHAFTMDGQYLYVIGDDVDMRLDQSSAAASLRLLQQFRNTTYAALPNREDIYLRVLNRRQVEARYYIRVPLAHLSAADQAALRRMGFSDFYGTQDKRVTTHLTAAFEARGEITRFANREAILAQYRLKRPLLAKVTYRDDRKVLSWDETIAAPLAIPAGVIAFPLIHTVFKGG